MERDDTLVRWLVVASQTVTHPRLHAWLAARAGGSSARVDLVVPATRLAHQHQVAMEVERRTVTGGDPAYALARWRLERALAALQDHGVTATGGVGVEDPVAAVRARLRLEPADRLVLCTLPTRRSRWLRRGVDRRLVRHTGLSLEHLELAPDEPGRGRVAGGGTPAEAGQVATVTASGGPSSGSSGR